MGNKGSKSYLVPVIVIVVMAFIGIWMFTNMGTPPSNLKYYEVVSYFQKNEVKEAKLDLGSGKLEMVLKSDENKKITYKVPSGNQNL